MIALFSRNSESTILFQFAKSERKTLEMWVYGIKLVLVEKKAKKVADGTYDLDVISGFFQGSTNPRARMALTMLDTFSKQDDPTPEDPKVREYIDSKLREMEDKMCAKLEELETRTSAKLDAILAILKSPKL